jgi:UDP-glucose 4-epimerase
MSGILVTGASGFVGRALCADLARRGERVVAAVRSPGTAPPTGGSERLVGDLAALPDLGDALAGIDCVVHLAARAHVMRDRDPDPEFAFRRANAMATRHLAERAALAGVKRLVFLSSVKVNGEATAGQPFRETDPPAPLDAYGRSKQEAESALREIAASTGLETVVIRPPLVYGPGVKANFRALMTTVAKGLPLPLASIDNRRSLVAVWNLCDLIATCVRHPGAAGETFLVSDGQDLSTPELVRALGHALGRPARLFPMPPGLLRAVGSVVGRGDQVDRVIGSLQVDGSKAMHLLAWQPPIAIDEGIDRTARWYLQDRSAGARA